MRLSAEFPNTWGTLRTAVDDMEPQVRDLFPRDRVVEGVDASDRTTVNALLQDLRPDLIVNCVGVIKQRPDAMAPIPSITVNSLLPHWLAVGASELGRRVVHFSTDCVFTGQRGHYTEDDPSDANDLYGRSKYLGEISGKESLTLRTSFIGRELTGHASLLDWFIQNNHGTVKGYRRVWWSGVTSNHLAALVASLMTSHQGLSGVYHVSSGRISKYELLLKLRDGLGLDIEVLPDDTLYCDRSLDGSRFEAATGYECPSWEQMISELRRDPVPYDSFLTRG